MLGAGVEHRGWVCLGEEEVGEVLGTLSRSLCKKGKRWVRDNHSPDGDGTDGKMGVRGVTDNEAIWETGEQGMLFSKNKLRAVW